MRKLHWVFILPVLAGPVFALSWTNCTIVGEYEWSYNTLGQNPCAVATYLVSPCTGGFTINRLVPPWVYVGPTTYGDYVCLCNTVVYSLVSACAGCQGASWIPWSQWAFNYSNKSSPSTYSPTIPNETRVPHWAYFDVTNNWNATEAQLAGDSPEVPVSTAGVSSTEATSTPGSTAGASSTGATSTPGSTAGASSTASQSHSSSPSLNQNKSHSGKIAGASAGVLVAVLLLIGVILWYLRRWRSRAKILPARFSDSAARIAGAFGLLDPNHSMAIGRYYDPSDPNTFPRISGILTMPSRENVHDDEPTGSINGPQYRGLPII